MSNHIPTTDEINAKNARQQAALSKEPQELTYEEFLELPSDRASDLMAAGAVTHLGFGARRGGRRR